MTVPTVPDPELTTTLREMVEQYPWPVELDHHTLAVAFDRLTGGESDPLAAEVFEEGFLRAIDGEAGAGPTLDMRAGGWKVRVTSSVVKFGLATALIAGVLHQVGVDDLSPAVLSAALPFVVDVERARLSSRHKSLLIQLRHVAGPATGIAVQPAVLYNKLPDDIKGQVSPLDFVDFMDALIAVGAADDAGGSDVRLRAPDEGAWLRICWE